GLNLPLMTADGTANATVTPVSDGFGVTAGVQSFTVTGTTGTFTLSFNGSSTSPLPVGASAQQVETALNALSTIGGADSSVSVSQSGNVYSVTFPDDLAGGGLPQLIVTGSGGASASITGTSPGAPQADPLYVGTIAMDPNNSRVLYIGTGETNNSTDS